MKNTSRFVAGLMTIALILPTAQAFDDVPADAWYAGYVQELESMNIIDTGDSYFPDRKLNRAEMVKMVITAIDGLDGYTPHKVSAFDDVKTTDWFYPYVDAAATLAIVSGYADQEGNFTGYFGPGDDLTRAAAVKILIEAFDLKTEKALAIEFLDVSSDDWFYSYVKEAQAMGIVSGYEDGNFLPNQPVTRAEIAKMMLLAIQEYTLESTDPEESTTPDPNEPVTEPADPTPEEEQPPEDEVVQAKPNQTLLKSIVLTESSEQLVARYNFEGLLEGFNVQTMTVANDPVGDDIGDDTEGTPAISKVTLKFPNKDGELQVKSGVLKDDGTVKFSGLDFFVQKNQDTFLEIYATIPPFSELDEAYSGEEIRLGLPNLNNSTDVFKAVGDISSKTVTFGNGALLTSLSNPKRFTIRKTTLNFAIADEDTSGNLASGTNDLMDFSVNAASTGSASLARMVFDITVSDDDGVGLDLDNFTLFDGSEIIENVVIYDANGLQELSNGGNLTNGTHKVIVSFDDEEIISAGETKKYRLRADITGAASDDDVITRISDGDHQALSGLTTENQENTGKLFVNGDAAAGIFTNDSDFSRVVGTYSNVIWSDQSAQPHNYADITDGVVVTETGKGDWTNGYLLGLSALPAVILSN